MYRIRVFTNSAMLDAIQLSQLRALSSQHSALRLTLSSSLTRHTLRRSRASASRVGRRARTPKPSGSGRGPAPTSAETRETERREPNDFGVWTYEQPPYSSAYCRLVGIPTFHKINYHCYSHGRSSRCEMESRRIQQLYRIPTCYRYTAVTGERRAFRVTARALLHSRSHPSRDSRLFQVRLSISLAGAWSMVSAASLPRYLESRLGPLLGPRSLRVCSAHAARRALARCGPPSM